MNCPCGSQQNFVDCCQHIHLDQSKALTAEQLMRARYTAFVTHNIDFLYQSFHPATRRFQSKKDIQQWSTENKWMQLHIIKATTETVEFEAHYLDVNLHLDIHREKSTFKLVQKIWYYYSGVLTK